MAERGVESGDTIESQQPDLLIDILGEVTISAHEVKDHAKNVADVALVHHTPRGTLPPRQCQD